MENERDRPAGSVRVARRTLVGRSSMDIAPRSDDDVLAAPIRARLFAALAALRRPATTRELAGQVGRHANTARVQLQRLAEAGLIECRTEPQARGRPRHTWAILPGARPGGAAPEAHADLSRWLARALREGHALSDVEAAGREIGRGLAPRRVEGGVRQAMQDALTALGFAPRSEATDADGLRYVLCNCPYRDAVAENQPVVCTLHRGMTRGLLDRLAPERSLTAFVAKDPLSAGCLIELSGPPP
jgi:predicted ArsR family transcriptional regulator